MSDALFRQLYQYESLEATFREVLGLLSRPPGDEEAWLINLQNHLIWNSYQAGEDPDLDLVVLKAISALTEANSLQVHELDGEVRKLLDELTPGWAGAADHQARTSEAGGTRQ